MFLGLARLSSSTGRHAEQFSAGTDGGGDFANNDYRAIAGSILRTAPSSASVNR
jgi:hypothetical protein